MRTPKVQLTNDILEVIEMWQSAPSVQESDAYKNIQLLREVMGCYLTEDTIFTYTAEQRIEILRELNELIRSLETFLPCQSLNS